MISEIIKDSIQKVVGKSEFDLTITENQSFGDYTTNAALKINSASKSKNPRGIAEDLKAKLEKDKELMEVVEKIEIAGPGFINFWVKEKYLLDEIEKIEKEKQDYGKQNTASAKTAIVEYSSPNIAKPFTIGHLRSTIIGDAIANLLEATGWKVLRDNHLGDWGTQFGKQIYAIKTWGDEKQIENSENPVKELVALYVKFHEEAEIDPSIEDNAREWFKKLEDGDPEAKRLWQKCIDWSWAEFNRIYSQLGVTFSKEFNDGRGLGESFFEDKMPGVIKELIDKDLLKEGEKGAKLIFFEKDKYPALMILKNDGASLYSTRDLATDKYRMEKYNPDLVVNEVGAEQSLYFRQIYEVENILGWYKKDQRVHVGHGLIRFKEGKMSTRKGNTIWLDEVLTRAQEGAYDLAKGSSRGKTGLESPLAKHKEASKSHLGIEARDEIEVEKELRDNSKVIGIGALKWNDLKRDPKTDIVFDWDELLNMEGNSGPYLQYTYARSKSVLENAKSSKTGMNKDSKLNKDELLLLRSFPQFSEVIADAAKNYSPNILANYLYNLAQKYNTFYNSNKIIGSENEEVRLAITAATAQILNNGLKLLGIETLERM